MLKWLPNYSQQELPHKRSMLKQNILSQDILKIKTIQTFASFGDDKKYCASSTKCGYLLHNLRKYLMIKNQYIYILGFHGLLGGFYQSYSHFTKLFCKMLIYENVHIYNKFCLFYFECFNLKFTTFWQKSHFVCTRACEYEILQNLNKLFFFMFWFPPEMCSNLNITYTH